MRIERSGITRIVANGELCTMGDGDGDYWFDVLTDDGDELARVLEKEDLDGLRVRVTIEFDQTEDTGSDLRTRPSTEALLD